MYLNNKGLRGSDIQRHFQLYSIFNYVPWWSVLFVEETRVPVENYRPAASHWQTLLHNVVSNTPRHELDSNSQL